MMLEEADKMLGELRRVEETITGLTNRREELRSDLLILLQESGGDSLHVPSAVVSIATTRQVGVIPEDRLKSTLSRLREAGYASMYKEVEEQVIPAHLDPTPAFFEAVKKGQLVIPDVTVQTSKRIRVQWSKEKTPSPDTTLAGNDTPESDDLPWM